MQSALMSHSRSGNASWASSHPVVSLVFSPRPSHLLAGSGSPAGPTQMVEQSTTGSATRSVWHCSQSLNNWINSASEYSPKTADSSTQFVQSTAALPEPPPVPSSVPSSIGFCGFSRNRAKVTSQMYPRASPHASADQLADADIDAHAPPTGAPGSSCRRLGTGR